MVALGRDLIQGVIDGIKQIDILQFIEDLFGDVIAIAKRILHISSPSGAFAEIGAFSALGYAAGIRASTPAAVAAVTDMMLAVGRVRPAPMALATVATGGGYGSLGQRAGQYGGQAERGDTWNVTINVQGGNGDLQSIGRSVEQGVLRAARARGLR
jgi:hypothetical protein